ncbi:hypothetical protein P3T23_008135 [Paraburkholderia sp. GAS448]
MRVANDRSRVSTASAGAAASVNTCRSGQNHKFLSFQTAMMSGFSPSLPGWDIEIIASAADTCTCIAD